MKWTYNDGGRAAAGYKGDAGDCVVRAIAIATGLPYQKVYEDLWKGSERLHKRHRGSPRNGVYKRVFRPYLEALGWKFVPTMGIGTGCKFHLRDGELPLGTIIASVSRHLVTLIDGVIQDTHDPGREGTRCVYGYFFKGT